MAGISGTALEFLAASLAGTAGFGTRIAFAGGTSGAFLEALAAGSEASLVTGAGVLVSASGAAFASVADSDFGTGALRSSF